MRALGNWYSAGISHFSLCGRIYYIKIFLLLYGHFSLNAAFIWWTNHQRVVTCAAVLIHEWNITHFLFAYGTYHPHTCMLAPKLNPLPRGIDIRYNTVRQEALPRMDTGWCLLLFHTIAIKILSSSLSIIFFNNWTDINYVTQIFPQNFIDIAW